MRRGPEGISVSHGYTPHDGQAASEPAGVNHGKLTLDGARGQPLGRDPAGVSTGSGLPALARSARGPSEALLASRTSAFEATGRLGAHPTPGGVADPGYPERAMTAVGHPPGPGGGGPLRTSSPGPSGRLRGVVSDVVAGLARDGRSARLPGPQPRPRAQSPASSGPPCPANRPEGVRRPSRALSGSAGRPRAINYIITARPTPSRR